MPLPAVGTISYNGVSLGAMTQTLGVRINPVPSPDKRTVTHSTYAFTFKTRISGTTTSAQTLELRRKILENGKPFRYLSKGLDLEINVGSVKDVMWGPKTQEVAFRPLGGEVACELVWTLEAAIPSCANAKFQFAPMAFSFSVAFEVDRAGYTTRRLSGDLMIPQTRGPNGSRKLLDSPDYYRERIVPDLLPGFRRLYGPWVVSEDRQHLTFEIVDEEMGRNIPPEGVVDVVANHRVMSNVKGLAMWTATLTATYELAKTTRDVMIPARHFFQTLVKDRVTATGKALKKDSAAIVPLALEFQEPSIYGRENKAYLSFTYSFPRELKQLLMSDTSLWRPVPDSNWRKWSASLEGTALNPRGSARLVFDTNDDPGVIDLCAGGVSVEPRTTRAPAADSLPNSPSQVGGQRRDGKDVTDLIREACPKPPPEASWIYYECEVWLETDNGTVAVVTLPEKPLTRKDDIFGAVDDWAGAAVDAVNNFLGRMPPQAQPPGGNVVGRLENDADSGDAQRRCRAVGYVHLIGRASRAGHVPPVPRLVEVAGVRPVPANRIDRGEGIGRKVAVAAGEFPIYTARWHLRYLLPEIPEKPIPIPPNPMLGG